MTEDNKTATVKISAYRHWVFFLEDAQHKIEGLNFDLEYQHYEQDVTQRLHNAATGEKERRHWEKQSDRINKAIVATEANLAKKQRQAAYCEAMLAVIREDLVAEGIDPDSCDLDDFFFDDEFDDDFDNDFSENEIPF